MISFRPRATAHPALYSIMGDLDGFRHDDVNKAPESLFGEYKCTSLAAAPTTIKSS
ncbi:MAG: hypothetical protein QM689_01270 [Oscillospiraceae bacterium]